MSARPMPGATIARRRSRSTRDGLVPAIAQQHDTGEVLMMAWMNRDAVAETPRGPAASATGRARARRLWRKGETLGPGASAWSSCASIATATRCCCWSIRPASPATPGGATASSAPGAAGRSRPSRTVLVDPKTLYGF